VIVPPSWIVKVPRKGSFKSSLKTSPNKKKKKGGRAEKIDEADEDAAVQVSFLLLFLWTATGAELPWEG
jgi:diacylglycerol kinase (ATP)